VRRACLQLIENRVTDTLGVTPQIRIPEPQRLNAERLQELFPFQIMLSLVGKTVLAAVQFHIQFRRLAKEIEIINTDRMLPTKFVNGETPGTQPVPDKFLRPGFSFF
jgi:hypothetical protein